jgi:DNA-binding transcriptional regulator GbsR (MarR family)
MQSYFHPMLIALPFEALMMLGIIALHLKKLKEQNQSNLHKAIFYNKQSMLSDIAGAISHQYKTDLSKISFLLMQLELELKPKEQLTKQLKEHITNLKTTTNEYMALYSNNYSKQEDKRLIEIIELLRVYSKNGKSRC